MERGKVPYIVANPGVRKVEQMEVDEVRAIHQTYNTAPTFASLNNRTTREFTYREGYERRGNRGNENGREKNKMDKAK